MSLSVWIRRRGRDRRRDSPTWFEGSWHVSFCWSIDQQTDIGAGRTMRKVKDGAARTWVQSGTPARIDDILTKARDVLVRDGYADFNLRKVAAEVGVRLATIQHHFATREALLTAAITKALEGWGHAFVRVVAGSGRDPEQQLRSLQ